METGGAGVRVTHGEIFVLAAQLAANPPDGAVTISEGKRGEMFAQWSCRSRPVTIGYPQRLTPD